MKTQLSKPARSKARYTDQYKQEALELWRASGRSAAKVAANPFQYFPWTTDRKADVIQTEGHSMKTGLASLHK